MIIARKSPKQKRNVMIGCTGTNTDEFKISRYTENRMYLEVPLYDGYSIELSLNYEEIEKLKKFLKKS